MIKKVTLTTGSMLGCLGLIIVGAFIVGAVAGLILGSASLVFDWVRY